MFTTHFIMTSISACTKTCKGHDEKVLASVREGEGEHGEVGLQGE